MAKKKIVKTKSSSNKIKKTDKTLAVIGLILNVFILPGLGTLIAGRTKTGIWQLVLSVIGLVTSFILIGIPILIVAWVWGLITGIKIVQESG